VSASTDPHLEGPPDDERQALELAEALEAWARWNAHIALNRSFAARASCGWPNCPDHGWWK
jgi:hypothetical protein